jgi:hypothetical protein
MVSNTGNKLVIAISSRVLFDMSDSHAEFETGKDNAVARACTAVLSYPSDQERDEQFALMARQINQLA